MIKIIIPIDADTLEGNAALLKMNMKPGDRDAVFGRADIIKYGFKIEEADFR